MLWFSGLRGGMAFALALEAASRRGDDGRAMLTATMGAVAFTVLGIGGLTTTALRRFGIRSDVTPERRGGNERDASDDRGFGADGAVSMERRGFGGGMVPSDRDPRAPDEVAVLIRSEKADGAALKRSAPTPTREGRGRREETASSGSDELRRSFRTFDERFLTPMFTLDRAEAEREGEGGE
jgi:NhaP-type Na+/H+ or K+/H+ antiporter